MLWSVGLWGMDVVVVLLVAAALLLSSPCPVQGLDVLCSGQEKSQCDRMHSCG